MRFFERFYSTTKPEREDQDPEIEIEQSENSGQQEFWGNDESVRQQRLKLEAERQMALQDLRQKRMDRWQKYHQERTETPPQLEEKDFLDKEGREVNFLEAKNWDELIDIIRDQGTVVNQNGLELPAEKVVNMMYKLAYQHFDNFDKTDWTNITLRHGLRQAVAEHIYRYQKTAEFQGLKGLDLSPAEDMETLFAMLRSHKVTPEAQIIGFDAEQYIADIQEGRIDDLPGPIKNKVIEINKAQAEEKERNQTWLQKAGKSIGKLAFWRK
jgi:hypothetical protein